MISEGRNTPFCRVRPLRPVPSFLGVSGQKVPKRPHVPGKGWFASLARTIMLSMRKMSAKVAVGAAACGCSASWLAETFIASNPSVRNGRQSSLTKDLVECCFKGGICQEWRLQYGRQTQMAQNEAFWSIWVSQMHTESGSE